MKVIFINARFLTQPITGVQRFAIEICKELKKIGLPIQLLAPHDVIDRELSHYFEVKVIGKRTGHLWEQLELPLYLKKQQSPILLNLCNTAPLFYHNNIITLHDLAFLKHPEWFSLAFRTYYNYLTPKIAKKAKFIFTVSNSVKKDLQETFNLTIEEVAVVYNGLPSVFMGNDSPEVKSEHRPYFLAFGGKNPRKNIKNILKGMSLLNDVNFDLHIIDRAQGNFTGKDIEDQQFNFKIVHHSDINDEQLKQLYKHASGLLYPSLYEGFGLPPLEAINSNCPILLSEIDVFKELYSEVAIFCDPSKPEDIKDGILKLIDIGHLSIDSDKLERINHNYSYWKAAFTMNEKLSHFLN